jgi:hypothetical protein
MSINPPKMLSTRFRVVGHFVSAGFSARMLSHTRIVAEVGYCGTITVISLSKFKLLLGTTHSQWKQRFA